MASVCLKLVHLFERITETYQFSGLLAKCLAQSEPCHYITVNINEVGQDGLDIGTYGLGDLGQVDGLENHGY